MLSDLWIYCPVLDFAALAKAIMFFFLLEPPSPALSSLPSSSLPHTLTHPLPFLAFGSIPSSLTSAFIEVKVQPLDAARRHVEDR